MTVENYRYRAETGDWLVSFSVEDEMVVGRCLVAEMSVIAVSQWDEDLHHVETLFRVTSCGDTGYFRAMGPDAMPLRSSTEVLKSVFLGDLLDADKPWWDENLEAI